MSWSIEEKFISAYSRLAVGAQNVIDTFSKVEKLTRPSKGEEQLSKIEEEEEVWKPSFADAAASLADDQSCSLDNGLFGQSSVSEDKQPQSGEEVSPTPPAASSPRPNFYQKLHPDKVLVENVIKWLNEQDNKHIELAIWLEPAIITILDEHIPHPSKISPGIACLDAPNGVCHTILEDWQAWHEHVAKLLCSHIVQALPDYVK